MSAKQNTTPIRLPLVNNPLTFFPTSTLRIPPLLTTVGFPTIQLLQYEHAISLATSSIQHGNRSFPFSSHLVTIYQRFLFYSPCFGIFGSLQRNWNHIYSKSSGVKLLHPLAFPLYFSCLCLHIYYPSIRAPLVLQVAFYVLISFLFVWFVVLSLWLCN